MAVDKELVGEGAEGAQGEFVFDFVVEEGAAAVGFDVMAVTPVLEGAAELDVAEAFEPSEVFDEGVQVRRMGEKGMGRMVRVRRVPVPAVTRSELRKGSGGGGGGT